MTQPGSKKKGAPVAARRFPWAIIMALGGLLLAAAVIVAGMSAGRSQQDQTAGAGGPSLDIAAIERSPAGPVEGLKVDFGELKMGSDMATVQLTVRNRGAKALQFSQAPYVELAEGC